MCIYNHICSVYTTYMHIFEALRRCNKTCLTTSLYIHIISIYIYILYMYIYIYLYCICIYIYMYIYNVYVYMYMYICICICIYTRSAHTVHTCVHSCIALWTASYRCLSFERFLGKRCHLPGACHGTALVCTPVIKHGNGKSLKDGSVNGKSIYKWRIYHCQVWLAESMPKNHSHIIQEMKVSGNGGTPKSSILLWFSMKKTIYFGVPPIYGNPQMLSKTEANHVP